MTPSEPIVVCVIPSRYGSTRLAAKSLISMAGKPMVQWVWEAARAAKGIHEVLVATDDERIASVVREFGGEPVMTSPDCASGTDRIQQAMIGRKGDIILNVQGDEPLIAPAAIEATAQALIDSPWADVSTVCVPLKSREDFEAAHIVKVVRAHNGQALYFSRSPIPSIARVEASALAEPDYQFGYKHLGLYGYRRESLEAFVRIDRSQLEITESLEQLRFLEMGAAIVCPVVDHDSVGVDVADDVEKVVAVLRARG